MNRFLLICFLLVLQLEVIAQQPQFQERIYATNTTLIPIFTASTVTRQGNILLSGPGPAGGSTRKFTYMLLDQNLDTIWTRKGLVVSNRIEHGIKQTPDNGFIAANTLRISNKMVMGLEKLDAFGNIQWTRTYTTDYSLIGNIFPLPGGGYFIGGQYGFNKNFSFMKTDNQGNIMWQKDYTWSGADEGFARMAVTQNNNLIGIGYTQASIPTYHIKAMVVDHKGDSLLGKQLVVNGNNRVESAGFSIGDVLSHSDGGYVITGAVDTLIAGNSQDMGMIVKTNNNLNPIWKYVIRTNIGTKRYFLKTLELADGSIIALSYDAVAPSNQFYLYHFNNSGQLLNLHTFQSLVGTRLDRLCTFDALPDGSFVIGGMSSIQTTNQYSFYVAKVKIPNLPLVMPPLVITGTREESFIAQNSLGQSYPNPTAAEAIIPYNLPKGYRKASIVIREIATGREIRKYELKRSESSLKVDVSNFSNGLYLYSLVVDEKPIATRKLAVMK